MTVTPSLQNALGGLAAREALRDSLSGALGPKVVQLASGETGYYMRRGDDCFQAAVATCLQVPIDDVPDWRLNERHAAGESVASIDQSAWAQMFDWLASRGLRMQVHFRLPVRRRRWIGVVPISGAFGSHCLVMDRGELIFDPVPLFYGRTKLCDVALGRRTREAAPWRAVHVKWGCSFVRINQPTKEVISCPQQ